MYGLNLPTLLGDWFAPGVIALTSAILAAVISKYAENKISARRAFWFSVSVIGAGLFVILFWYNAIGMIILSLGETVKAKEGCLGAYPVYKDAIKWNPKLRLARMKMVNCGIELKRSDESIAILEPLESLLSDDFTYWAQLSWAYYGAGSFDKMLASIRRAVDLEPTITDWVVSLGSVLHYDQEYQTAESVLRVARISDSSDPEAVFWLAWSLYEQHRYDDAIPQFDECIRLNSDTPRLARCIAGKGFTVRDMGRNAEAIGLFETSLQLDATQTDVREALAQLGR